MEGTIVGNYRIIRKLSEGGMGAVYEAVHSQLGKRAVLKALRPEFAHKSEFVQRLFDEARAVNLIEHPGLVDVFDCGQLPDHTAFILMEYLRGEPLGQRMKRGSLDLGTTLRIGRQIASALAATHDKGVIHRDLKPDNIMIIADPEARAGERIKILDFGIARVRADLSDSEATRHRTQTGTLMGTPIYMSPEQCRGAGHVDERTDVYSLGVILYRMITGRPPFLADGVGELMLMHMSEPPPSLHAAAPGTPKELSSLIHQMLEKDRESRPSMQEVAERIEALRHKLAPHIAETQPPRQEWPTQKLANQGKTAGIFTMPLGVSMGSLASTMRSGNSRMFFLRRTVLLPGLLVALSVAVLLWLWLRAAPSQVATPNSNLKPLVSSGPTTTATAAQPPASPPQEKTVTKPATPSRNEKRPKPALPPQFQEMMLPRDRGSVEVTELPE